MGVTTWLDRITDESNLWLSASKAEEAKDHAGASVQYLNDASECLSRGSKVRAALSCYCAAGCLSKMGAVSDSKKLYHEAGRLYAAIADHNVSGSIREALWALQRSYGCFTLAGSAKDSETVFQAHRLLSRRANPFNDGSSWLEMPKVAGIRREDGKKAGQTDTPLEVEGAIDRFMAMVRSDEQETAVRVAKFRRRGGMSNGPESLVSQLG